MDMCICKGCDKEKPAIAFALRRGKRRGVCRDCMTTAKREREAARKADPSQDKGFIASVLNDALRRWRGWVSKKPLVSRV